MRLWDVYDALAAQIMAAYNANPDLFILKNRNSTKVFALFKPNRRVSSIFCLKFSRGVCYFIWTYVWN